eukprot:IDg1693t1
MHCDGREECKPRICSSFLVCTCHATRDLSDTSSLKCFGGDASAYACVWVRDRNLSDAPWVAALFNCRRPQRYQHHLLRACCADAVRLAWILAKFCFALSRARAPTVGVIVVASEGLAPVLVAGASCTVSVAPPCSWWAFACRWCGAFPGTWSLPSIGKIGTRMNGLRRSLRSLSDFSETTAKEAG